MSGAPLRWMWYVATLAICICCGARLAVAQTTGVPVLVVDAAVSPHPINPDIYGIASYGLDAGFAKEIQVPNIRWGGDGTTRYNWLVDSSNAGFDWYFMGGNGQATPTPGASADLMVTTYKTASNARALVTIPIIPYVNKTGAWNCSFPVSVYGPQQSKNPYVHPNGDDCGNSLTTTGAQLTDNNIYANHIDNTTALQQGWVQHLVATFGTAANGGVSYYQLDNEPGGWSNTHRDVEPAEPDYDTIISLGQQYAAAIKQTDASAKVFGPVDFTLGGWIGTPSKQNNLYAGQYYLQKMATYDQTNHQRILDYFDEHYYGGGATEAEELASTRALWDSTFNSGSWVEQYYFDGPMMLLPRFQNWIATYYPETKLSISEYSFSSGTNPLVDALTEADVLGIYGREGLDFANMWNAPKPTDAVAYSFRLYRNYDGAGGQFGDMSVSSRSSDQRQLSVYGALRSSDGALTVMTINKTTSAIATSLTLANFNAAGIAAVYGYSNANLTQIVAGTPVTVVSSAVSYTFPAYSATMLVFAPRATAPIATTTSLSASAEQATSGQRVTFTATVTSTLAAGTPTGSVNFLDGAVQLGTVAMSSSAVAVFSSSTLAPGAHEVTAAYAGDSSFSPSASHAASITIVAPAKTSTTTTIAASATRVTWGQAVTFAAIVAPLSSSSLPTGSVAFFDGAIQIGTGALDASGVATLSASGLVVGTHSVMAVYGGDTNFATSTSAPALISVSAAAKTGTNTIGTASAMQVANGQNVTLSATVMPTSGSGTPTGSVTFLDGPTSIGVATLSGGTGSVGTGMLSVGTHTITVMYSGDANFSPSTSNALSLIVVAPVKIATVTVIASSATQLTNGQSVIFSATVIAQSGTGIPTGSVAFLDGGSQINTASLSAGTGSFTSTTLAAGSHTLSAVYGGDANYRASSSTAETITVAAAPAANYSLAMSSSSLTLAPGGTGKLTITVTAQNGFKQTLQWSCSNLPGGGSCGFSAQSVNPATGEGMTILTVHAPSSEHTQTPVREPFSALPNAGLWLLEITAALLPLAIRRQNEARGTLQFAAVFVTCAILSAVLSIAGCANTSPGLTQATTYDVTITASALNAPTHTGQFQLTVTH
jgi:Glycoside hydrolase family 44/Bacterial Ig-like domain (group 3)